MQRNTERESIRLIREEIHQTIEQRTCCPLSFCQSINHKSIADCDHPDKYSFVGQFHNAISRQCFENSNLGTLILSDVINYIKNNYFTEEHITDEQIEILLFRLSTPLWITWGKTRAEKINAIMERYAKLTEEYYYGHWDEPDGIMMDQIDILALDQIFDNIHETNIHETNNEEKNTADPTQIQLLFKESENTNHGYLTVPNEPNNLLECPICYESECFITTNCRHVFCECILKHIATSTTKITTTSTDKPQTISCCPCCREPIFVLEISHKKNYQIISAFSEFYT